MERKVPLDQFIQNKGGINKCTPMSAARRRRGIFHWWGRAQSQADPASESNQFLGRFAK
jgi:hypothetical protein